MDIESYMLPGVAFQHTPVSAYITRGYIESSLSTPEAMLKLVSMIKLRG